MEEQGSPDDKVFGGGGNSETLKKPFIRKSSWVYVYVCVCVCGSLNKFTKSMLLVGFAHAVLHLMDRNHISKGKICLLSLIRPWKSAIYINYAIEFHFKDPPLLLLIHLQPPPTLLLLKNIPSPSHPS